MADGRSHPLGWVPFMLFVVGVFLASMVRGDLAGIMTAISDASLVIADDCLGCQRNTAWIYWPLRGLLSAISHLMFLSPDAAPLAVATPWEIKPSHRHAEMAVQFLALYGYRVVLALPAYVLVCRLVRSIWHRLVLVVLLLCILGGWPALVVNVMFTLAQQVVSWPPSYYLFVDTILSFDWSMIGFLPLLALLILRGPVNWWQAMLMAAFGQVLMDNLGLVTGIALGLAGWRERGWRHGGTLLVAAGIGTVVVFSLFSTFGTLQMEESGLARAAEVEGVLNKMWAWLGYYWDVQAKYNFLWLNVTIANMLSVMMPAVLFSAVASVFMTETPLEALEARRRVWAILAPCVGFALTVFIGMFKSGYGSDLGRQMLPLAVMTPFLFVVLAGRWRSRPA